MAFFHYKNKQVYYSVRGEGETVILIHGNTGSSRMCRGVARPLSRSFKVVLVDLPGHGRSQRLEKFPVDFWYENGMAVIALIEHLGTPKVSLVGTSGGALVALNAGLQRPELIDKIVADSFEGDRSVAWYAETLKQQRNTEGRNVLTRMFWRSMHGPDWRQVVDQDTEAVQEHHRTIGNFFHKKIESLRPPVLLTGSLKDEYITNIHEIYMDLEKRITRRKIVMFPDGGHPAMLSCKAPFLEILRTFLITGI